VQSIYYKIKKYYDNPRSKKGGKFFIVLIFILLPQTAAAVISGCSAAEAWQKWRHGEVGTRTTIFKIVWVWVAAAAWLVIFWGGIVVFLRTWLVG
jgi:hypothetical protein